MKSRKTENNTGRMGLTTRWIVLISSLLLAVNVLLGLVLMLQTQSALRTQMNDRSLDVANSAAALLDGDVLRDLTAEDVGSPAYMEIYRILYTFEDNFQNNSGLKYIYALQPIGEREFAFTIDPDAISRPGSFGEKLEYYSDALFLAGKGHAGVEDTPHTDEWGRFYTAYSPVQDSNGKVVGIIGVDFDADWYDSQVDRTTVSVLIVSIISLVAGILIVLFITNQMKRRFDDLHRELNMVADDVETLTGEITSRPGFKAIQPEMKEQSSPDPEENGEKEEKGKKKGKSKDPDPIDALSQRMRGMQSELRRYISFAHELAYTDAPTGVGNKTAYIERVHAIQKQIANGNADFSVAVFDINGLKTVNDNYGHEYGDMIIADAALVMMRVCKRNRIFRIGGDEFIALLEGFSSWETEALFSTMDKVLENFNANEKTYEMTLSFSKGAATFRPGEDKTYQAVFKRADEAMYADKGAYYRQFGDRRRRKEDDPPQKPPKEGSPA